MKAIDLIRNAMQISDQAMLMLVEDMKDAPLAQPTPCGGNHPLWVLGHVTFIEGNVPHVLFGEPNPVGHWAPLFAAGTEPKSDAAAYPPFEEVLRTYRDLRARNLQILERLGDAGLDQPTKAPPPGLEAFMRTAGEALLLVALHQMSHRGQVADARRTAGRKPVFTPG
ncbi:MAG TPA: DinB family protein [Tepidisphaeraceae bacterium]|jgi:hypothetical protein